MMLTNILQDKNIYFILTIVTLMFMQKALESQVYVYGMLFMGLNRENYGSRCGPPNISKFETKFLVTQDQVRNKFLDDIEADLCVVPHKCPFVKHGESAIEGVGR